MNWGALIKNLIDNFRQNMKRLEQKIKRVNRNELNY